MNKGQTVFELLKWKPRALPWIPRMLALLCLLSVSVGERAATAQTFSNEQAWDDGTNFHYEASYTGSYPNFNVYLDTNNSTSGLAWYSIYANYLIENTTTSSYSGSAGSWSWSATGTATETVPQTGTIEFTTPLSAIGSPAIAQTMFQVLTSGWVGSADTTVVTYVKTSEGLTATAGSGQVSLSWTASPDATSYNIYRGTSSGGESSTAVATGVTSTSYVNTGLTNGTTYYYEVKAVYSGSLSGYSNEASAAPAGGGITVATPTYSPTGGTYSGAQTVTISDSTSGASIYYTTNGTTPTTSSTKYTAPISVASSETVEAIGAESGDTTSAVGTAGYTINTSTVATPTFSPAAGTYTSSQSVTISDSTSGSTIYYTTNGTTPTTSSTKYTAAISVTASETIEALGVASGDTNSAVASAAYTINTATAATPTFSPGAGSYSSTQSVTISDTTSGAAIYYTTNGTTPTTSSTHYTGAISVGTSETVEAIAVATGYTNSAVGSAVYTITATQTAATPTYSPTGGTYSGAQTVTISDTTSGATIYYTTNGTTPTTSSTHYTGAISVATSETVEAIAAASGYNNSSVGTAGYTITTPTAATPTFSPAGGTYTSTQSVTLSDTTSGAAIYYTTNGTTPTTSSTHYTGAISVTSTETIEAIAAVSGYNNSSVGSATYTISGTSTAATPTFSPAGGTYTSTQSVTLSDTTSGAAIYYTTNGTTPTTSSTHYTGAISVSVTETIQAIASASGFNNSSVGSATYTISLGPTAATPTFSPAGGTYSSTQSVTLSDATSGATLYYTTNGTTPTTSSTQYTGAISVASSETIEAIAAASGDNNSAVGSASYTITSGTSNYYVSPSGSDSNAGTIGAPWLTVQHAASTVGPGSTVFLRAGTYGQFDVDVSGSASGGYITFTNYPGEAAVIDGTSWNSTGLFEHGLVDIEDQSYIQIVGLEIRNAISNSLTFVPDGVYVRNQPTHGAMSHIVIQNCYIHNIEVTASNGSGQGNAHGIASEGDTTTAATALTNVTVTGCTLENMVTGWSETSMFKGNLDTFTFTNNLVQGNNNIGVDMAGGWGNSSNPAVDMARNGYCAGNIVDNCSTKSNPVYNDYSCAGIYVDGGDNIIIEHNMSYNNDIGIQCSSERPGFNSQYVTVRSNLVYNSNTQGLGMGGYNDTATGGTKNCSFVNNTFYNDDIQKSGKGEVWGAWFCDNNLWENNICYGGPEGLFVNFQVPDSSDNGAVCNYNDYYDATISNANSFWTYIGGLAKVGFTTEWQGQVDEDLQSVWSNPLFVSSTNFNVSAGSPALNAGSDNLGNITFDPTWASTNTLPTGPVVGTLDLAGNPRTVGSSINIGAYQD